SSFLRKSVLRAGAGREIDREQEELKREGTRISALFPPLFSSLASSRVLARRRCELHVQVEERGAANQW
ncbi:hypothetical protein BaRGS_00038332, partial [Batillaria attramentaria]